LVIEKEIKHKDKTVKQQFLAYFLSEVLTGSKKFYSEMEKICYIVIMSSRKLPHYFKAHTIKVSINQPLNAIFGNRGSSGRISKWAIELLEYIVDFKRHSAIKSQVLADLVVEWTEPGSTVDGRCPKHHGWSITMELGGQQGPEQQPYSFHHQELSCAT
jgi:hypothetical protein